VRLVDLDRDMSDVFPVGKTPDSEHLFRRMEEATFDALGSEPGARVIDVAAGVGQDDQALARRGVRVVGAEPSARMMALARLADAQPAEGNAGRVSRLRAWSERLPFRGAAFDGAFCKGSLDHFDDPLGALREMARVTRADGRVVLAVANFESLGCRLARALDRFRRRAAPAGRRPYDVPSDHFTRYDPALIREQMGSVVQVERWTGVSLLWGFRPWTRLLLALGPTLAELLLRISDAIARRIPSWADVIVVAGRPRG
jgi:SAM-dependent methyltransferase